MTLRIIELRSDTFTRPTQAMRRAMYEAEVGDDVWDEDPTVQRLEERSAELTGKEAALFVASGTQGNLVGVLSHTSLGDELVAGDQSHIVYYEVAGAAVVGGLQLRTLPNVGGSLALSAVRAAIRKPDIHAPRTGCLAIENTHNRCGGAVLSIEQVADIAAVAHDAQVPVHMDGARIFNAAVALGNSVRDLAAPVDSITYCLSKGLGAPVGSVLCGSSEYIARARRWRKMLGGGMRQVGVLAAAGLVALDEQVDRLADDHANARRLANNLCEIDGLSVDPKSVMSNIVLIDVANAGFTPEELCARLLHRGIRLAPFGPTLVRAVTSYEVDEDDIDATVAAVREAVHELSPAAA